MKKLLLSIFIMLLTAYGHAQELPNVFPQAPNTHSLGKYGEVSIGMFTGSPNLNIPLHTVGLNKFSMPISLAYNSNGIKVDQYSSSVGSGWDLIVGGVITRNVNDNPDEILQVEVPDPETMIYTKEMLFFLDHKANLPAKYDDSDYQPDLFSFNVNGYSGQFFLKRNTDRTAAREAVMLSASPLKIEVAHSGDVFTSFTITDPNGVEYTFYGTESSKSYSSCHDPKYRQRPKTATNAWYLSEISVPNEGKINLNYKSKKVIYDTGVTQSITVENDFNSAQDVCPPKDYTPCKTTTETNMLYLESISGPKSNVTFSYSHKAGMPSGMDKLDEVLIKNNNNRFIKKYNLSYDSYAHGGSNLNEYIIKDYHNVRFFLNSVTEENSVGETKNPYLFEYINPNTLPSRFSFSQDIWGFFNGKRNDNLISLETVTSVTGNGVIANGLSDFKAADRSANFNAGRRGLLNKISYPTKGYNKLYYEPNSHSVVETVFPPYEVKTQWSDTQNGNQGIKTMIVSDVGVDHWAKIKFLREMIEMDDDPILSPSADPLHFAIKIIDLTTNEKVCVIKEKINSRPHCSGVDMSQLNVTMANVNSTFLVELLKDHKYEFKIVILSEHTKGGFYLQYYNKPPVRKAVNKEVGGGRISKIESYDNNDSLTKTKKYHYNSLEEPAVSSGFLIKRKTKQTVLTNEIVVVSKKASGGSSTTNCNTTTLSANSAFPVHSGSHIGYQTVIEELGEDFSEGGIKHRFDIKRRTTLGNLSLIGNYIQGTPLTNHFGLGKQLEEVIFKKRGATFLTVSSQEKKYKYDTRLDDEIIAYNIRKRRETRINGLNGFDDRYFINSYDITSYSMIRRWQYLNEVIQKKYDFNGENPVTTTTNYFYENENHLQPTRVETTNSIGETIIQETFYAHEENNEELINKHRIAEPIRTKNYKVLAGAQTKELSETLKVYNNQYLPKIIQTSKGSQSLEDRIVYHSYSRGNPVEVSKKDGTKIYYVWGYNQTQPIAKIEGYTAVQLSAAKTKIATAITASNNDINEATEKTLRDTLHLLRTAFPDAQVTTYTYDPLIGVTSNTDPRGQTIYYDYDDFNRLAFIKDKDGNILTENQYNYKN